MKLSRRTIIIILAAAFIVITGLLTVRRSLKGSNDFDTFYQSGRAVLTGQGIYYSGEYYQTSSDMGPFLYPPPAACFFALLAWLPLKPAAFLWNLLNIFFFAAAINATFRLLPEDGVRKFFSRASLRDPIIFFAGILTFAFFMDNLSMAQINILLYFLCVLGLVLANRNRPLAAGFIFSLAIWLKVTPALFAFYFLMKRKGRVLAGMAAGSLLAAVLIPLLVFGRDTTRIYYRQWFGRMIKPGVITLLSKFEKYEQHPNKKSPEALRLIRLSDMLTEKNQSLEAGLTRLFLKDRNQYALSTGFPIYAAQRYLKLPVIGGGLPWEVLNLVIKGLMASMLLALFFIWRPGAPCQPGIELLELSLLFISLILFSPFARSHQFISLTFPLMSALYLKHRSPIIGKILTAMVWIGGGLYLLQGLPYGKAAGVGTWAALTFWIGCFAALTAERGRNSAS